MRGDRRDQVELVALELADPLRRRLRGARARPSSSVVDRAQPLLELELLVAELAEPVAVALELGAHARLVLLVAHDRDVALVRPACAGPRAP